jgi:hypothetical protein
MVKQFQNVDCLHSDCKVCDVAVHNWHWPFSPNEQYLRYVNRIKPLDIHINYPTLYLSNIAGVQIWLVTYTCLADVIAGVAKCKKMLALSLDICNLMLGYIFWFLPHVSIGVDMWGY